MCRERVVAGAWRVQPVTPPYRILRDEADLDAGLAEVRTAVIQKLANGPVQL
ncbi:hypothetical protein [Candidatus Symbiobacter mobilis]|uniref:hypothetical protein n=1 Tax=Candidatus Symbiobacter mobilis TaxID=1436290 RepID=UPI0016513555|nr:hypothetical protein [Candidatus Symbiobacter mobilis]